MTPLLFVADCIPVILVRVTAKRDIGNIFDFEFVCDSGQSHSKTPHLKFYEIQFSCNFGQSHGKTQYWKHL